MEHRPREGHRRLDGALVAAFVLVAFALRAHRLAAQSLWSDEDITLDRVGRGLSDLLASLPVEHAPAYFVLGRLWTLLSGDSDLALRAPSLFFGVLAVPLAAYLGRRLLGPRTGCFMALLVAVNPFLVWYGQEARMYTMVAALALAALAAALRAQALGRSRWWIAAGLLAAATVYTHYYGALIVLVLALWAMLDVARGGWTAAVGWLTAGVAALLAFAPWLSRSLGVLAFPGWRDPVPLARVPWIVLTSWSAGTTASAGQSRWATLTYLALAGLGVAVVVARARRGPRRTGAQRVLLFVAVPLAVSVALVVRQPDIHPRYFLAVVAAYYLLVAAGASALPFPAAVASAAVLVLSAAGPLVNLYTDPAFQKQDFHAVIAHVEAAAGPRGAALLLDGPPFGMMERYRAEDSSVKIVNLQSSAFRDVPDDRLFAEIEERIEPYAAIWVAEDGGAFGAGRRWVDAVAETVYPVGDAAVQDVRLARFHRPGGDRSTRTASAEPVGEAAPLDLQVTAPDAVAAGEVLPVDLAWFRIAGSALGASEPTKISLRLVDAGGRVAAAVDREARHLPGPPRSGTASGGDVDRQGLLVPVDAAPGAHALEVVLYDAQTLVPTASWRWPVPIRVGGAAEAPLSATGPHS